MGHCCVTTHCELLLAVVRTANEPEKSAVLAEKLRLPLIDTNSSAMRQYHYVLAFSASGLALQQTGTNAPGPIVVDFAGGGAEFRRLRGGGELIVKAIAGNKQQRPSVLDVTAGLGRDSFVLASHGYQVTAIERSPVIASLLGDGLMRAAQSDNAELREIVGRIGMVHAQAVDYLKALGAQQSPDVIYIDPMFPASGKSALVKKQMRAFHHIVGPDDDSAELFDCALHKARHRVVVKRPKKAGFLSDKKPAFSLKGKAIRFDVYSLRAYGK